MRKRVGGRNRKKGVEGAKGGGRTRRKKGKEKESRMWKRRGENLKEEDIWRRKEGGKGTQ
jgi:hypothetical protein